MQYVPVERNGIQNEPKFSRELKGPVKVKCKMKTQNEILIGNALQYSLELMEHLLAKAGGIDNEQAHGRRLQCKEAIAALESIRAENEKLRAALENLVAKANTPSFVNVAMNRERGEKNRTAIALAKSALAGKGAE